MAIRNVRTVSILDKENDFPLLKIKTNAPSKVIESCIKNTYKEEKCDVLTTMRLIARKGYFVQEVNELESYRF